MKYQDKKDDIKFYILIASIVLVIVSFIAGK